jgi:ankyrin repeat protein
LFLFFQFKESALTLACYKGHLEMVRFLLEAGADQEHKTDEMHTALMEASMDGHVEVARLLLDSGAQVSIKIINLGSKNFGNPSFQMVL